MLALAAALALALPASESAAIQHVSVVNVETGRIQKDVTVLLADGSIVAIDKNVSVGPAKVVDGKGKFLIPGLWDMHVHCCNSGDHFFPLFLANGVTGIRDMGGPLEDLKTCRSNVESGIILGPRMVFSGPIVDGPKPVWKDISIAVITPEEGRKAVETVQRSGADFVKVYSLLPRDAYFAIAIEAKKRHIVFAGHVPDLVTASEASDAGQKSFEHLLSVLRGCSAKESDLRGKPVPAKTKLQVIHEVIDSYDARKANDLMAQFGRNGTWQCPTLTVLHSLAHLDDLAFRNDFRIVYLPPDIAASWNPTNDFRFKAFTPDDWKAMRLAFAVDCKLVGMMSKSGVGLLAGTDTPNPYCFPGFGIHNELALLVQCGLTPLQALQTATINPAHYFGWEKTMGTVEVGKVADLVLLDANPLDNIHNAEKIEAVFVRGRYLGRPELDQMLRHKSEAAGEFSGHEYRGIDPRD